MNEPFPLHRFLHPRYWPTWLGLGLLWLVVQLPQPGRLRVGRWLGALMYVLLPRRRHIAAVNLGLCFPELGEAERRRLLRAHHASLGMMLIEMGMHWWLPDRRLRGLADYEGLEHLDTALRQGKGVILLAAHFTTLEIGGRLLLLKRPFHPMYRHARNALIDEMMRRGRTRRAGKVIHRDDVRGMLRSLKQNMPVWYAPDQNYGREHSIFVPFFGVPAATIVATSRLARVSGAPVVPFFQRRMRDGRYRLCLSPALEDFPSGDLERDARRINALIEQEIRLAPEQYLWVHRRFKTRPEGGPGVY